MPPASQLRIAKEPSQIVRSWADLLRRAAKVRNVHHYASEDLYIETAARIALVGTVGDGRAIEVFQAFIQLFFNFERVRTWDTALNKIPPNAEQLVKIARACQACQFLLESVERASFPLTHFIKVVLAVPDPKTYIEACKKAGGHSLIRTVFNPNTLDYVSKRFRGVVGELADPAYRTYISSAIKPIT